METDSGNSLIKFQIGPVQDFIEQARSTRDLWSGSYLLSWLMAAGIRELLKVPDNQLIFPNREAQPLLEPVTSFGTQNQKDLLTPNLPNLFVAHVPAVHAKSIADQVKKAIEDEWDRITKTCLKALIDQKLLIPSDEEIFLDQSSRHLSIAWQITPETGNYHEDFKLNGRQLDAVRQTRDFKAWNAGQRTRGGEKDSLTGREESIVTGSDRLREKIHDQDYKNLFKHDDHLGAVSLIKRVWHLAYLGGILPDKKWRLKTSSDEFKIPNTRGIASHSPDSNGDLENVVTLSGEKYFAVIALDGDQIGKWISGDFSDLTHLEDHHRAFGRAMGTFALEKARAIVEEPGTDGRLIYAGGDDVLALVPADTALKCACQLREAFRTCTEMFAGAEALRPDCSAGIAMAHFKSPLQDVIHEARMAEKRAKRAIKDGGLERSAFAITLLKRSGEITRWGARWESGGLTLYQAVMEPMVAGSLSARFPHRVCQILEPYLTTRSGISIQDDANVFFPANEVITREFMHAAIQQGNKTIASAISEPLKAYLTYMSTLGTDPQTLLTATIGLCTTLAFAHRTRNESQPAERQTA